MPACVWYVQVDGVVRSAVSRHGRIDGVVNCVGNVTAASTLATELQQLEEELKVSGPQPSTCTVTGRQCKHRDRPPLWGCLGAC